MFGPDPEADIRAEASAHLHKLDFERNRTLFIRMDENAFRAASFLDDRILTKDTKGAWLALPRALAAAQGVERQHPLHFIFHAGHVGSTLVSRLLDELTGALPLREPQTLRQLAQRADSHEVGALLDAQVRLWRRGFADTSHVILKATSSASRMGPALLAAAPGSRAVFLNLRPEPFLATCLAGENTPIDLRGMGAERSRRLSHLLMVPALDFEALSLGQLTAMTWLAETLTHARVRAAFPDRTLAIDFEDFLVTPGAHVARIAQHFAMACPPELERRIGASSAFSRYSKAPEHDYSPALRTAVLNEARAMHGGEIRNGLAWIADMAKAHPQIADLLKGA